MSTLHYKTGLNTRSYIPHFCALKGCVRTGWAHSLLQIAGDSAKTDPISAHFKTNTPIISFNLAFYSLLAFILLRLQHDAVAEGVRLHIILSPQNDIANVAQLAVRLHHHSRRKVLPVRELVRVEAAVAKRTHAETAIEVLARNLYPSHPSPSSTRHVLLVHLDNAVLRVLVENGNITRNDIEGRRAAQGASSHLLLKSISNEYVRIADVRVAPIANALQAKHVIAVYSSRTLPSRTLHQPEALVRTEHVFLTDAALRRILQRCRVLLRLLRRGVPAAVS